MLTASGPEYRHHADVESSGDVRHVGYTYYTVEFAQLVYREMILHDSKVKSFLPRLHMRTAELGNPLAGLFPSHCKNWWPLIEDIFASPAVSIVKSRILNTV